VQLKWHGIEGDSVEVDCSTYGRCSVMCPEALVLVKGIAMAQFDETVIASATF